MVHSPAPARLAATRFHGTLLAGSHSWHVYFVDVTRADGDWIIQCSLVGPAVLSVTIRCRADATHRDTARRVMNTLRDWLQSDQLQDSAYLEVPPAFDLAS